MARAPCAAVDGGSRGALRRCLGLTRPPGCQPLCRGAALTAPRRRRSTHVRPRRIGQLPMEFVSRDLLWALLRTVVLLPYGLLSDCAYACWSWYEARGVLSARPLAGHAPEGKTGCREPHGFASDSHAAAGPCEYRGRSHEARLLSTWSMSAQSKRLAAWRAAERIRRTSSRSSSFTIK